MSGTSRTQTWQFWHSCSINYTIWLAWNGWKRTCTKMRAAQTLLGGGFVCICHKSPASSYYCLLLHLSSRKTSLKSEFITVFIHTPASSIFKAPWGLNRRRGGLLLPEFDFLFSPSALQQQHNLTYSENTAAEDLPVHCVLLFTTEIKPCSVLTVFPGWKEQRGWTVGCFVPILVSDYSFSDRIKKAFCSCPQRAG